MKRMNLTMLAALLLAVFCFATPVFAEGGGRGREPGEKGGKMMEKMGEELGLTREQQDQVKALRESGKEKAGPLREKSKAVREAMREELNRADTDSSKVKGYVEELTALYRQKLEQRVDGVLGMKKVLTPEQFSKLNEKMEQKKEAWREKRGFRGPGRGSRGGEEADE